SCRLSSEFTAGEIQLESRHAGSRRRFAVEAVSGSKGSVQFVVFSRAFFDLPNQNPFSGRAYSALIFNRERTNHATSDLRQLRGVECGPGLDPESDASGGQLAARRA